MPQSYAAIVLGYFFFMHPADLDDWFEQQTIDQQLRRISAAKYPSVLYREQHGSGAIFAGLALQSDLEMFTAATAFSGYLSLLSDQDDAARSCRLSYRVARSYFRLWRSGVPGTTWKSHH